MARFAMMDRASPVGRRGFIVVNVGRQRWRESVLRRNLGAIVLAISCWVVEGMFAREDVMKVSVGIALFKGRGLVLVEREHMKGWHVMFLSHYAEQLARSC